MPNAGQALYSRRTSPELDAVGRLEGAIAQRIAKLPAFAFALLVAAAYFALVHASLALIIQPEGISVFWPPSGFVFATLALTSDRRKWLLIVATLVPVQALANALEGRSLFVSLGYAAANLTACTLAAYAYRRATDGNVALTTRRQLLLLLAVSVPSCALSATIAAAVTVWGVGTVSFGAVWFAWGMSALVGTLVAAPLLLSWLAETHSTLAFRATRLAEYFVLFVIALAVTLAVFGEQTSSAPDLLVGLYLPFPLLIWAGLRFQVRGAALISALLATVAIALTVSDRGPLAAMGGAASHRVFWLQAYIVFAILTALLVAVVIKERMRAEADSRRLAAVIEQSPDGIAIARADGAIEYVNAALTDMLDLDAEDLLGQDLSVLTEEMPESSRRDLEAAAAEDRSWMGRFGAREQDGHRSEAEVLIAPVRAASGAVTNLIATRRDVTREAELEEQLRHSQKLEAIGQLAGGVAHDFNNVLTVILGNVHLMQRRERTHDEPDPELLRSLREVEDCAQRAARLTGQLLAFSRRHVSQPEVLDLNLLVAGLEKMLRRLLTEDISLSLNLGPDLPSLRADPSHLEQIIVNLTVNARDAMSDGGRLIVTTRRVVLEPADIDTFPDGRVGPHVVLEVQDTGEGIDPEVMPRIFEPFYTTRHQTGGTGLGLATVYGVTKQSGGHIRVRSSSEGTTFAVYFPAVSEKVEETGRVNEAPPTGRETVLICEDDDGVRRLAERSLRNAGYSVLSASSGKRALELSNNYSAQIDLLITDVIMPEMNGRQLADAMGRTIPGVKTLFISGYTADVIEVRGSLAPDVALLPKPYTEDVLLRRVRDVLDG